MDKILKTLGISEEFTKAVKKQKVFNKIKSNIPMREDYNFMADLLFLPLPFLPLFQLLFILIKFKNYIEI